MTQLPPSDESQWQEFLRRHSPPPPPPEADLEEQLMNEIAKSEQPAIDRRLWTVPPAIAAGLLMAWSGYRAVTPFPELSSAASLAAFLENNWNDVIGEAWVSPPSTSPQVDWMPTTNTANSLVLNAEYEALSATPEVSLGESRKKSLSLHR